MTADQPVPQDRFIWVEVASRDQLHQWLRAHHDQQEAVWLVTWKMIVPARYVPHDEVLDELVAFGWCDGIMRRVDEEKVRQLVSPRRRQPWAKSYQDRAERLIATGAMHAAGMASVAVAKATGMWVATADVDALLVPDDLRDALDAHPPAAAHFDAFPPSTRRNILRWIASAKTPPTRLKRITATTAEAQHGRRVTGNG